MGLPGASTEVADLAGRLGRSGRHDWRGLADRHQNDSPSIKPLFVRLRRRPPIAPGKSVAFATRLRVPLGPNSLFWELDPFGSHNPQLHARVTLDR